MMKGHQTGDRQRSIPPRAEYLVVAQAQVLFEPASSSPSCHNNTLLDRKCIARSCGMTTASRYGRMRPLDIGRFVCRSIIIITTQLGWLSCSFVIFLFFCFCPLLTCLFALMEMQGTPSRGQSPCIASPRQKRESCEAYGNGHSSSGGITNFEDFFFVRWFCFCYTHKGWSCNIMQPTLDA